MNIIVKKTDRVVTVTLNRPDALNALNTALMTEMIEKLKPLDNDPDVGCFIITGSEKFFAAGADIKEMRHKSYIDMMTEDYFAAWEDFANLRTPKIAAVSGYALGGGCELALMCDIIIASDNAKFGQPEIKLGVIPGIGGSQRLTKLIGKSRAMDLILTGRMISAEEAENWGIVSQRFPVDKMMSEVMSIAEQISSYSKPSVIIAKECVDRAFELGTKEGVLFERRLFHSLFSTEDQKEGMDAFITKRTPNFTGK
ncbi:enoyl-CoA hydratase-related protein [bacterium]|nr:enoyl-CoA hydratase-related protein [bacterium]